MQSCRRPISRIMQCWHSMSCCLVMVRSAAWHLSLGPPFAVSSEPVQGQLSMLASSLIAAPHPLNVQYDGRAQCAACITDACSLPKARTLLTMILSS